VEVTNGSTHHHHHHHLSPVHSFVLPVQSFECYDVSAFSIRRQASRYLFRCLRVAGEECLDGVVYDSYKQTQPRYHHATTND
jgi:hypothetical protein